MQTYYCVIVTVMLTRTIQIVLMVLLTDTLSLMQLLNAIMCFILFAKFWLEIYMQVYTVHSAG